MKTAETLLACCVVGLACFIGGQSAGVRPTATRGEAAGAIEESDPGATSRRGIGSGSGTIVPRDVSHDEEVLVAAALPNRPDRPSISANEMRRRLAPHIGGTYLRALLRSRDSVLTRWPDRTTRPLRVFIRDGDELADWNPDYLTVVRDAFDTWVQANIPVRFIFVIDSASADVRVHFTNAFANGISGKTVWSRDAAHWLVSSNIELAVSHPGGGGVTPPQMRAIALHEVGHALGLDHAESTDDIMSAHVRVRELSEADRSTVRLLYTVPAGSVK